MDKAMDLVLHRNLPATSTTASKLCHPASAKPLRQQGNCPGTTTAGSVTSTRQPDIQVPPLMGILVVTYIDETLLSETLAGRKFMQQPNALLRATNTRMQA